MRGVNTNRVIVNQIALESVNVRLAEYISTYFGMLKVNVRRRACLIPDCDRARQIQHYDFYHGINHDQISPVIPAQVLPLPEIEFRIQPCALPHRDNCYHC